MLSHLQQPSAQPLLEITIGEFLAERVREHGNRIAVIDDRVGCRWTYRELAHHVAEWRNRLSALGLTRGERIALLCENSAEWISVWLACSASGIVVVSLNLTLDPAELRSRIDRLDVRFVFASVHALSATGLATSVSPADKMKARIRILPAREITGESNPMRSRPSIADRSDPADPNSPCLICFSSGTTGAAKAIVLTHRNLLNNAALVGEALDYGEDERVFCLFPYLVAGGAVIGILGVLARGATIVCPPTEKSRAEIIESLNTHRPHHLMASPRIVEMIFSVTSAPQPFVADLRRIGMGSTICLPRFVNRLLSEFKIPAIALIYGMTETSPVSFLHSITRTITTETMPVGHLLPHLEAKIIDTAGRIVEIGEEGELCVRGHAVMAGYCNDPVATSHTIDAEGWLHTGDLARFDADGVCSINGRKNECIRFRNRILHPHVIEQVFLRHPAVENTQVAALPDGRCCAWVKLASGSRITRRMLSAHYRRNRGDLPPLHHLRLVAAFPLNETGKVQRDALIAEMTNPKPRTHATRSPYRAASTTRISTHKH